MYYPRFTKAIIHYFITKDKSISMRNIMFMHTTEDDSILIPIRFVSKADDYQVYGALLPEVMTNQKMRGSPAYKTYLAFATSATSPKKARKYKKPASPSRKRTFVTVEEEEPEPAKKVAQVKKALKRSRQETTIHQEGGSGDGTGSKLGTDSENQESNDDDDDESDDEFVHTPPNNVPTDDETNDESNDVNEEEYDRIDKELYGDVNVRLTYAKQDDKGEEDADMTDVAHV
ncbi:hypothetical protein Tco_1012350 [Tanacetum coccineum]|uniref:Uncharacterized protein n=1 Tax=Tanacetum coccineum TaxID=301880 RepID=A0ABQ5BVU7_9ASTR